LILILNTTSRATSRSNTRAFGKAPSAEEMSTLTDVDAAIEAWEGLHAYLTDCDEGGRDSLGGWSD